MLYALVGKAAITLPAITDETARALRSAGTESAAASALNWMRNMCALVPNVRTAARMGNGSVLHHELQRRFAPAQSRASAAEAALREAEAQRQLLTGSLTHAVRENHAAGVVVADSQS